MKLIIFYSFMRLHKNYRVMIFFVLLLKLYFQIVICIYFKNKASN